MSFTLFASRKSEINTAIASIQQQIALLQQQLADQQALLQEVGTAEQAGESALNQMDTFLSMVRAIDPSQEAVFWRAADAKKSIGVEALAPSSEVVTEPDPAATTTSLADEPGTIEVEAVEVDEKSSADDEGDVQVNMPDPSPTTDTIEATEQDDKPNVVSHEAPAGTLHKQPAKTLQWLASKRGIDTANMKRHQIASALTGLVTHAELKEAVAQTTKAV